jgi:ribosomal protein L14E/L6E/L27E
MTVMNNSGKITKNPRGEKRIILKADSEYLSKPFIEGAEFIIEDNYIKITTPTTVHVETRRVSPLHYEEFTSLYKSVIRTAKYKKVKISYTRHIRRDLIDRWDEYITMWSKAHDLFNEIVRQAIIVRERGLHYGTIDDSELKKLQNLCEDNRSYFYGGSIISRIADDYFKLKSISQRLEKPILGELTIYL